MLRKEFHTAFLALMLIPFGVFGQEAPADAGTKDGVEEEVQEVPLLKGIGRLSLKFNAVDLLCTVPNLGLEFDLGNDKYSQRSLSLSARYNWAEPRQNYQSYNILNVFEVRTEYRQYMRGLVRSKRVPYAGMYLSGGSYSMKFSPVGHQGLMYGLGASMGFVTPLHEYRKFAIDLEIGGSVGICMRNSEAYRLSEDSRYYVTVPQESVGYVRPVFWPVVSELRVAFVFRKVSVKNRYQLTTEQTKILRQRADEAVTRKNRENRKKREKDVTSDAGSSDIGTTDAGDTDGGQSDGGEQ